MPSFQISKIFVIGGTGAQGLPIVRGCYIRPVFPTTPLNTTDFYGRGLELVKDRRYQVRVMTRDPDGRRARDLAVLPGVELFRGTFANEDDLTKGFTGCDGAVSISYLTLCFSVKRIFSANSVAGLMLSQK